MKMRIVGVIVLIIAALLTFLVVRSMAYDLPVWLFGIKANAVIEDKWWQDPELESKKQDNVVLYLDYYFQYRFTTTEGQEIVGASKVTEDEYMAFQPGSEIAIKYSRFNPENNRVDDSRFVPFMICSYIPFILMCAFTIIAGKEMLNF